MVRFKLWCVSRPIEGRWGRPIEGRWGISLRNRCSRSVRCLVLLYCLYKILHPIVKHRTDVARGMMRFCGQSHDVYEYFMKYFWFSHSLRMWKHTGHTSDAWLLDRLTVAVVKNEIQLLVARQPLWQFGKYIALCSTGSMHESVP